MNAIALTRKTSKRSGIMPVMLAIGFLGALYCVVFYQFVGRDLLSKHSFPPMLILLTQAYMACAVLNLFSIIIAACALYHLEFQGNAIQKLKTLPVDMGSVYLGKCLLVLTGYLCCVVVEFTALVLIGLRILPAGSFSFPELFRFFAVCFIGGLPSLTLMLLVSSQLKNMWVTLGIGIAGFFSMMAMGGGDNTLFYLNPFYLILQPALRRTLITDWIGVTFAVAETVIFTILGVLFSRYCHNES